MDHALDTNARAEPRRIVVLLVDDQAFVAAAIGQLIATERDIDLHSCLEARDAVAIANQLEPAIILQDLVMPDIDGLTLLRLYRANPSTAATPVIVLSGNDDLNTRARALEHGANDYLVKLPAKPDLIACLRRWSATDGGGRAVPAPDAEDRATTAPRPATGETLDRSAIAAFLQPETPSSAAFARTLIDQFVREAASQIDMLEDAARRSDAPTLKATAHSLKGSSMTMGARRLAALCGQAEDEAGRQSDRAAAMLLAEIGREFASVRDALAAERHHLDRR